MSQNASSLSCVLAYLLTALLARLVKSTEISPSVKPLINLPDGTHNLQVQGFSQGIISSQVGDRYSPNTNCRLRLSVNSASWIRFTFEHLDLPPPGATGSCSDSVQLFCVVDDNNNLAVSQPLCGSVVPTREFVANCSTALIVFQADAYQQSTGFKVFFERITNPSIASPLLFEPAVMDSSLCPEGGCQAGSTSSASGTLAQMGVVTLLTLSTLFLLH